MAIQNLEREREIVRQGQLQGKSTDFIKQAVLRDREKSMVVSPSFLTSTAPSFPASKTGQVSDVPTNIAKTFGNIPSSARNLIRSVIAPVNPLDTENPLNIWANIAKGGEALYDIFKTAGYTGGIEAIAGGVAETLGKGRDLAKGIVDKVSGMSPADIVEKVATTVIEDPLLIPSLIYAPSKIRGTGVTEDAISKVAKPFVGGADTSMATLIPKTKEVVSETVKNLTQKSEAQIESAIVKKFEKGVKPLLPAKTTPNLLENYREDIVSGIKTIKENKLNLKYADEVGNAEVVVGKSPETLQQLTDAIEQTKKTIFTKYNEATKQSGKAGLTIETAPISMELESVISNEALKISNPEAIKYAQDLQKRLANFDIDGNFIDFKKLDPSITQDVIQNYNKSLEAFYRTPTYDTASRAAIDAMVANKFRQALDEGVTSLTGTEYQVLKNQYGSLKAIERDVIKATLRDARKNVKGLIDFTDILSGAQVVSGLLTLNPATLAQGLGARAIKEFYKYLNNPNRAIKAMFQEAEKLPQSKLPNKNLNILSGEGKSLLQTQLATSISTTPSKNVIPPTIPQIESNVKGITLPNKQGGFIQTGFKNEGDLTTKILKDLEGKTTVSKQYILDATNRGELKQVERDITRQVLDTMPDGQVNVKEFADKVKSELLPLEVEGAYPRYEGIALPSEIRGSIKNYEERVYNSPVKTSAGRIHFSGNYENYFGHTRIEDMADNKTRRVIEVQSDLYQKGNLERETQRVAQQANGKWGVFDKKNSDPIGGQFNTQAEAQVFANKPVAKLQQYNDPTAHFRMVREEIKKAAQDGKTKLQFPTGETAMKIEGLGEHNSWFQRVNGDIEDITPDKLKVGMEMSNGGGDVGLGNDWIITDVLGDGKFKAVPKDVMKKTLEKNPTLDLAKMNESERSAMTALQESFDISGKVDTNNPIYKFYEKDVQKYLNKFGGKRIVDDKGVSWIEIPITKEQGKAPVEAFGKIKANPLLIGAGIGAGAVIGSKTLPSNKKK